MVADLLSVFITFAEQAEDSEGKKVYVGHSAGSALRFAIDGAEASPMDACPGGFLSPDESAASWLKPSRPPPRAWRWVDHNGKVSCHRVIFLPP